MNYETFRVMVKAGDSVKLFDVVAIDREAAIADVLAADSDAEILNTKRVG